VSSIKLPIGSLALVMLSEKHEKNQFVVKINDLRQ